MAEARILDSLTKVLAWRDPAGDLTALGGALGQTISLQLAWRPPVTTNAAPPHPLQVRCSMAGARVSLHAVELVPVSIPCWRDHDEGYLDDRPGLYPDLLRPLAQGWGGAEASWRARVPGWNSIWIDLELPCEVEGLAAEVRVEARLGEQVLIDQMLPVEVLPVPLDRAPVTVSQWFHADSLAEVHGHEVWSPEHWTAVAEHLASAGRMGVTSVLAPIWTLPLDTPPDQLRTRAQLLGIRRRGDSYDFEPSLLDRWCDLMEAAGITDIEVPHLFSQWGASSAPQIWVEVDGVETRLFDGSVAATDPEYAAFLNQLLPWLRAHLEARFGGGRVRWHVSDEPADAHRDQYERAWALVRDHLAGAQIIDATGHPGALAPEVTPVVALDAVGNFRTHGIEPTWVYYCVAQAKGVANRFIAQDAVRHRLLGHQLHRHRAEGCLHWAFNSYSPHPRRGVVDPFTDTCAEGGLPGGDSFVVYPGPDGRPLESIRHRVLREGLADFALARLGERVLGPEVVSSILEPEPIDYDGPWPSGREWLDRVDRLRREITVQLPSRPRG